MKFICAVVVVTANLASIGFASAQAPQYPTTGMVYNTIDASFLVHRCSISDNVTLDCEFTQTSVRRKLSAEEAVKKLEEGRAAFDSNPIPTKQEDCAQYEGMLLMLQGKKPAPDSQGMAKMTAREKANALQITRLFVSYCRDPSVENHMKVVSYSVDRDKRTCLVSSNHYNQKFRRVDASTWTVVAQPYGPCGVVELSRFELEKSKFGSTFWNYFARKAVTNPNADVGLVSCKMLDEREYKYQWQKRDPDLNCEFVEFSPL